MVLSLEEEGDADTGHGGRTCGHCDAWKKPSQKDRNSMISLLRGPPGVRFLKTGGGELVSSGAVWEGAEAPPHPPERMWRSLHTVWLHLMPLSRAPGRGEDGRGGGHLTTNRTQALGGGPEQSRLAGGRAPGMRRRVQPECPLQGSQTPAGLVPRLRWPGPSGASSSVPRAWRWRRVLTMWGTPR